MKTPNGKYSCKNGYLQRVIHPGRASACGEKFTVMTACNTFEKRPAGGVPKNPAEFEQRRVLIFHHLRDRFSPAQKVKDTVGEPLAFSFQCSLRSIRNGNY